MFSTPEVKHLVVPSTLGKFSSVYESCVWKTRSDYVHSITNRVCLPFVDASNKHFGVEISGASDFRRNRTTLARLPNCTKHLTLKIRRSSPMLRKFPSLHHVWMHFRLSSVALKAFLSEFHTRPTFSLRLISNSIANPRFLISQSLLASLRVQESLVSQAKCERRGEKNQFQPFSRWRRVPNPSFLD